MSEESFTSTGVPAPGASPTGGAVSQFSLLVNTLIAPGKAFGDIQRSASWFLWLLPFVVISVLSVGSIVVIDREVGFDVVTKNTMAQSPKAEDRINQLPDDQKAKIMAQQATFTKIGGYVAPVILLIFFGMYALILWGVFNFVLGAETKFQQIFAVTWYAALPLAFLSVLTILTLLFGGDSESFLMQNPVGTNLAFYMPDAAPMLKAVLAQFDIFKLWSLVLAVVGMAKLAKKSVAITSLVLVPLWIVPMALAVLGAAFS